jgi:hypothetical protein
MMEKIPYALMAVIDDTGILVIWNSRMPSTSSGVNFYPRT